MDPRVLAAAAAQGGLVARATLLDLGHSPGEVRRMVRHAELHVVRRGVYAPAAVWDDADEYVGRPRLRARAAVRTMKRGWVLSHDSAAHELGLPVLWSAHPLVHVTRPGWTNAWTEAGVRHHLARFSEAQLVERDGLPVLNVARTAVDIARDRGWAAGVVACDGALRLGVPRRELEDAYEIMRNWPGVRTARGCVEVADAGAESPHESLARLLVLEAGIGVPETQFPIRTEDGEAWCDLRVGHHVIEADGRIKYRRPEDGGVAPDPEQALWDEKQRQRAVEDQRFVVSRLVWADYWGERRKAAIRRLRRAQAQADARFGVTLDPRLAAEAEQLRARGRRPA